MNRRDTLKNLSLITGITLSGSLSTGLLTGCTYDPGYEPQFLKRKQDETVSILVDMIIPATDTPGALAVGANQFIDRMLARWATEKEQEMFIEGLAHLEELSQGKFAGLSGEEREQVLKTVEKESHQTAYNFYRQLRMLTLVGYYTSEVGASQELIYLHAGGEWKADIPYSEVGKSYS